MDSLFGAGFLDNEFFNFFGVALKVGDFRVFGLKFLVQG